MNCIIEEIKKEIKELEKALETISRFRRQEPEGCLKYQNKGKKTFYYHQFMNEETKEWERRYIKRENLLLAKNLAQKHYYAILEPLLAKQLKALKSFLNKYHPEDTEQVYDKLSEVRKSLIIPIGLSREERIRKWHDEKYEGNTFHPENFKYETEQGELVRSKSEMIIANILYQHKEDVLYKYERPLEIRMDGKTKVIYPDFTILNVHTGRIVYLEHAGRMDDPHYANDFVKKLNAYVANDLLPGKDVMITLETLGNPLDVSVIKRLVRELCK